MKKNLQMYAYNQIFTSDFSFTSSIPDRIDISTDAASVIVAVQTGTSIIFETELFPYNKIASLYDLRSIIEDFLAERSLLTPTL